MAHIPAHLVVLMLLPFYLNDFLFMKFQSSFGATMVVDYGSRILAVLPLAVWIAKTRSSVGERWFSPMTATPLIKAAVCLSVIGIVVGRATNCYLDPLFADSVLFAYPDYPGVYARVFDLSVGLLLVAFSEELVFRGMLLSWCQQRGWSMPMAVLAQCLVFGLIHWSNGLSAIMGGALWALAPTIFMQRYRNLYPVVVAHFLTDLVAFS